MERRRHFLRLTGENFSPVKRRILRKKLSLIHSNNESSETLTAAGGAALLEKLKGL